MIDHVSVAVRDIHAAESFYSALLAPLGMTKLHEWPNAAVGFGNGVLALLQNPTVTQIPDSQDPGDSAPRRVMLGDSGGNKTDDAESRAPRRRALWVGLAIGVASAANVVPPSAFVFSVSPVSTSVTITLASLT